MPSKREQMARLYGERMKRRVCIHCEQPAEGYIRCADCRADQAHDAGVRRITRWLITFMVSDTST